MRDIARRGHGRLVDGLSRRAVIVGRPVVEVENIAYTDVNNPNTNYFNNAAPKSKSDKTNAGPDTADQMRMYYFFPDPISEPAYLVFSYFWRLHCNIDPTPGNPYNPMLDMYVQSITGLGTLTPQTITWNNQGGLSLGASNLIRNPSGHRILDDSFGSAFQPLYDYIAYHASPDPFNPQHLPYDIDLGSSGPVAVAPLFNVSGTAIYGAVIHAWRPWPINCNNGYFEVTFLRHVSQPYLTRSTTAWARIIMV